MSEFGKELTYNLGLFLAHAERDLKIKGLDPGIWFYGAADHLFEFEADNAPTEKLKVRCNIFKDKCLTWRLPRDNEQSTEKDKNWAINEAKEILMEIDKFLEVETEKGDWE